MTLEEFKKNNNYSYVCFDGENYISEDNTNGKNFQFASCTKFFVPTLLDEEVEKGNFDWNWTLNKFYNFKNEEIGNKTFLDLVNHKINVAMYDASFVYSDKTRAEFLEEFMNVQQNDIDKGFSYSNHAFILAQDIYEKVSGLDLNDSIRRLLKDDENINFGITENIAMPIGVKAWKIKKDITGAGGLILNNHSMKSVVDYLLENYDEKEDIAPATAKYYEMVIGTTDYYEKGMFNITVNDTKIYFHTGGSVDQNSLMVIVPSKKFAFVGTNSKNSIEYFRLANTFFANKFGFDIFNLGFYDMFSKDVKVTTYYPKVSNFLEEGVYEFALGKLIAHGDIITYDANDYYCYNIEGEKILIGTKVPLRLTLKENTVSLQKDSTFYEYKKV